MPYTTRETYNFISRQTSDPIVERKTCKVSGQPFPIFQSDLDFYDKISPTFNGKKYPIPTPTLCPEERQKRRLAFRNEKNLYKKSSAISGQNLITLYSPDKPYPVYSQKERRSDTRDAITYGRPFTTQQSFFAQLKPLLDEVPKVALYGKSNENSEYTNDTTHNKNCYLIFASDYNENCYYGIVNNAKNSLDCLESWNIENCYECINCSNSYELFYAVDSEYCRHSAFLIHCTNCEHCFLSHNLNNKQWYFQNKPCTPAEYQQKIQQCSRTEAQKLFEQVKQQTIYRTLKINASENCIGNAIEHSYNCKYCFDTLEAENCSYVFFWSQKLSDCQDTMCASIDASKCYQANICLEHCHQVIGCNFCNTIQFSYYLNDCVNCSHCFGCVGLRDKKYCILNKQYTKEEYEILVPIIIKKMKADGERGEFFPSSLSPFGYNETQAQEYFPLTKDEAVQQWFYRSDYESPFPQVEKTLEASTLPDDSSLVSDEILQRALKCEKTGKPFALIKQEVAFYKTYHLPLPKLHPDVRHEARMQQRPWRTLYLRPCSKCKKEMLSVYPPEDTKTIYCEACYQKEIS